jgi:hypothetical protein
MEGIAEIPGRRDRHEGDASSRATNIVAKPNERTTSVRISTSLCFGDAVKAARPTASPPEPTMCPRDIGHVSR